MNQSLNFDRSAFDHPHASEAPVAGDRMLLRMLDEMEYGMVLVGCDGRLRYSNALGRDEINGDGPLHVRDGFLTSSDPAKRLALGNALTDALKGRRRLLSFASGGETASIAVTPMRDDDDTRDQRDTRYALLIFSKRPDETGLTIDFFARANGLTSAESAVLLHLARGLDPAMIADRQSVAISTVRTQIASVRAKTRAGSIRELLGRVAMLPPIRTALRTAGRSPCAAN